MTNMDIDILDLRSYMYVLYISKTRPPQSVQQTSLTLMCLLGGLCWVLLMAHGLLLTPDSNNLAGFVHENEKTGFNNTQICTRCQLFYF